MFDLLVKGGQVIDTGQGIDGIVDVATQGDKIAAVAGGIASSEGRRVIDARGKIVTPGLIDYHCHVCGPLIRAGVEPDLAGVGQGVTTVVDAGSTGEAIFGGFPRYVIPQSLTRVFCYLHLGSQGLSLMPELRDWAEIDLEATEATVGAHEGLIKGVKLRLVGPLAAEEGLKLVEAAKRVAARFQLPVMVHIGDTARQVSSSLTQRFLPLLEAGDTVSHVFTAQQGSALQSDGKVLPELKEAAARGVIMDTALGRFNLSYRVARSMMDQGIFPTTISTDLTAMSLQGPVYGLTVGMSHFLGLGLDLNQVVAMATLNPARCLGEQARIGSLRPGMEADISILEILPGRWTLADAVGQTLEVDRLLSPVMAVKGGRPFPAHPVARPSPTLS